MGNIISIINQKGGVGKTTTAAALGAGLSFTGRVLMVDLDPQCSLTKITGASSAGITAYEVLTGRAKAQEAIQQATGGHIIAAGPGLGAEGILTRTGKEYRLREALEACKKKYEWIVIDCPPSLGVLSINALTASNFAIVPATADRFSLEALGQFWDTYEAVHRYTNPALTVMGVLITRYSGRSILSRQAVEMIADEAEKLGTSLFTTKIREGIAVKEAQMVGQDIYSYAPKSKPAADYRAFTEEVIHYAQKDI